MNHLWNLVVKILVNYEIASRKFHKLREFLYILNIIKGKRLPAAFPA